MLQRIDSYIYTGVSFSTFTFDDISIQCVKYSLSKLFKSKYFRNIKSILIKSNYFDFLTDDDVKYYIHSTLQSLSSCSLLITLDKKEVKLATRYLKREVDFSSSLKIIDLSEEIKLKKACFILEKEEDIEKYEYISYYFKNKQFVILSDIMKERKNKSNNEVLIDDIKLKILQDDGSEIFFVNINLLTNVINDFIFSLNKIAVHI